MSAEGKKKRGESGRANALSQPFRLSGGGEPVEHGELAREALQALDAFRPRDQRKVDALTAVRGADAVGENHRRAPAFGRREGIVAQAGASDQSGDLRAVSRRQALRQRQSRPTTA